MRIDPNSTYRKIGEMKMNNNKKIDKTNSTNSVQETSGLVFDSKVQKHVEEIKNNEVYRSELVASIKERIQNGSYELDASKIASKLLG